MHHGIKIEQFNIAKITIKGFYLSLDKKLILEINSADFIALQKSQNTQKNDIDEQIQMLKKIHFFSKFFQKINIKEILFENYQANLFYNGEHFTFNLPEAYGKINFKQQDSSIFIHIEDLYFKQFGAYYSGEGFYNTKQRFIDLKGILKILDKETLKSHINVNLQIKGDLNNITLQGDSESFENTSFLRPLVPPLDDKILEEWIFDNYAFSEAKIDNFSLTIPLKSDNILKESLGSLKAIATAKNAEVTFYPNLKATSENVKIIFEKESLEFYPTKPFYAKHEVQNAKVELKNIFDEEPILNLSFSADILLDSDIHKLLHAFEISIPIEHSNVPIDSNFDLSLNLHTLKIQAKGEFNAKNVQTTLLGVPLHSNSIQVNLDNEFLKIQTQNTTYKDQLSTNSRFVVNTDTKLVNGDLQVLSLALDPKNPDLLSLKNQSLPFSVNFKDSKNILLDFPTLFFSSVLSEDYRFEFSKLSALLPYSQLLQFRNVLEGEISLKTKDFNHFQGNIQIDTNQQILLEKTNKPLTNLQFILDYTPQNLQIKSEDNRIIFTQTKEKEELLLRDLTLQISPEVPPKTQSQLPFFIKGEKANLYYHQKTILADSYEISILKEETHLQLKHKNGYANVYQRDKAITLDANEFGDEFMNTFFGTGKTYFTNGRFFINANTNPKGALIGKFKLQNTSVNELHLLQNLMAFIDTIPSLLSFKAPGFNNDGYHIDEGEIEFGFDEKFLAINNLDMKGSSIDILGRGIIVLENNEISLNAQLITAKSLSGIINKIPVVNYILLGKEGTISTNFSISGSLENPQISINTATDILLSPFNILKRTIMSPFEIFN